MRLLRGYSSAGRALEWHSRGQRFDPAYLHQTHYERLDFFGDQAFLFPQNSYRDDAGSFHRRSSVLPPIEKAVSTNQEIVKAAFFVMKTIFKARHDKATRLSAGNAVEELCQADARDESGVQPRDWSLFK